MKNGKWVTTSKQIPGALTKGGLTYGIYQRGGKDSQGNTGEEHVAIVKPDGTNLMQPSADGNTMVQVTFPVAQLPDLKEVTDRTQRPVRTAPHPIA